MRFTTFTILCLISITLISCSNSPSRTIVTEPRPSVRYSAFDNAIQSTAETELTRMAVDSFEEEEIVITRFQISCYPESDRLMHCRADGVASLDMDGAICDATFEVNFVGIVNTTTGYISYRTTGDETDEPTCR